MLRLPEMEQPLCEVGEPGRWIWVPIPLRQGSCVSAGWCGLAVPTGTLVGGTVVALALCCRAVGLRMCWGPEDALSCLRLPRCWAGRQEAETVG